MQGRWAFLLGVLILMVAYAYVSSRLSAKRKKRARQKTVPQIQSTIRAGVKYNIFLSDGRHFPNAEIIGSVENDEGNFSFASWEGMLVIEQESKKRRT